MRITRRLTVLFVAVIAGNAAHAQTAWQPERNIEIIVGSSAGTVPTVRRG